MTITLGEGRFRYEAAGDWGKLPDGWELNDVAAVAVDKQDRASVFNRGAHPMIVLIDKRQISAFVGGGMFARRMACISGRTRACTAPTTAITRSASARSRARYCCTIGIPGKPSPACRRAVPPLHAHCAVSARRYLCLDGDGNARVHKYSP